MSKRFLSKEYFPEKHYQTSNSDGSKFDIVVNEKRCSQFKESGILCDKCFNQAIIDKIQELTSLDILDFLNHQLNLYENPIDFLKRLAAFLNDNEDNFSSFNYSMVSELRQITESGIEQLSRPRKDEKPRARNLEEFIDEMRIDELRKTSSVEFDLSRLTTLAEEINIAFENGSYISVIMLTRALIDHIPPIFDQSKFSDVYAHYGSRSFKEHMKHLDTSMRKIADSYLHTHIRKSESLPSKTQVNFSQDVDVLITEIIRRLKE